MKHAETNNPTLSGRDILFECEQCHKSLEIDCRGAGLNIRCPDCDAELEVPIPEGFNLEALDKEISDSADTVLDLHKNVLISDEKPVSSDENEQSVEMKTELEALRAQRRHLEQQHVKMLKTIKTVNREVDEFRKALDELTTMLDSFDGSQSDGPQNDSPQNDSPQSDGPQSDGPHNDETQKMG